MFFKRKIYDKLLEWKQESNGRTAILVEGARRIGKSTVVKAFAQKEYKSFILIDFSNCSEKVLDAFDHMVNLDDFFMLLTAEYGVNLYPRESLIVFDEVQLFPKARQAIKHLVADGRYDYVETGSLISIRENVKDILIPSEERHVKMFPMDFEEFVHAIGESVTLEYIKQCFQDQKPLLDAIHRKAMFIFRQYMLVGGMPQAVEIFIDSGKNLTQVDLVKRDILALYRDDINKIKANYGVNVVSLFDQIPSFLSKHEKRVRLNSINDTQSFTKLDESFFWLGDSMITNMCFNCSDPNVGLFMNADRTYIKCYMGDTGLLISKAFSEKELQEEMLYSKILHDNLSVNQGMFFENIVAQMLVAKGYDLFFYNRYSYEKKRNDIEIDFIISNGSTLNLKIFPIEVKSGKRYTITSLTRFQEKFHERMGGAYVIHPKNFEIKDGITYLPAYMTFCL